jgi:hypothetical protein
VGFLVPVLGCGVVWFFGFGCFLVAVGMGERFFVSCAMLVVCWVGWEEDGWVC